MDRLPVYIMDKKLPEDPSGLYRTDVRRNSFGYADLFLLCSIISTGVLWVLVIRILEG